MTYRDLGRMESFDGKTLPLSVCESCGAVVYDTLRHSTHHHRLEAGADRLNTLTITKPYDGTPTADERFVLLRTWPAGGHTITGPMPWTEAQMRYRALVDAGRGTVWTVVRCTDPTWQEMTT